MEARVADDAPRVVVRPLENRASDSGDASFARGMHDALQSQLDKVSGLEVLSRKPGRTWRWPGCPLPRSPGSTTSGRSSTAT